MLQLFVTEVVAIHKFFSDSPIRNGNEAKAFEIHFPETLGEGKSISTKVDSGHHKDHAEVEIKFIIAIFRA